MKSKDLRIGNYICKVALCPFQVTPHELSLMFRHEMTHGEHKDFSGIPLTEEMLLKCEYKEINGFYEIGRLTIDLNRDEHGDFKHSAFIKDSLIDDFNYLHELQNIYYYTHKKQELKINL